MNKKRVFALLLAALMTGSAITATSCGKKETAPVDDAATKVEQEENDGPPLVLPSAEEVSTGDETFDIFLAYGVFDADYIVEEETGDTINDIIYQRNREVEDYFGFKFNFYPGNNFKTNSEATPTIRTQIQAGDDTYEVYMNVQHAGMPLIYEDLFVEWNENMPYANLDNPWWYQNVRRDLNFGDKIYVMVGDYNFHALKASGAIAFNKTIMDELELEYPYQLVKDGEWTIDKFIEYVKAGQKDLNGDGIIKPEDDRLGFSGWKWEMIPAMFVGMGGAPVSKDDDNLPSLNINNERTFNVIDKLIELYDDGNGAWDGGSTYGVANTMFKESRLLFQDTTLTALPGLRNLDDDFGALPYPKLDEDQEDYYSRIVNFSSLTYIPVTNQKLELTSAVLEYMAYISHQNLIPAFYDEILNIKTARDFETEEMINIIREGARFMDENYLNSGGIINIVASGTNTLSSNYASQGDAWETKLEDIIEFWEA